MRRSAWIIQYYCCYTQKRFMSTPKIKLKADPSLDLHAERDKLLRPIFKIRDLLLRRENHSLRLRYLAIKQKHIGLSKKNVGVKAYIRKYPNLFEIYEHPHTKEPWCRLSKTMEDLLEEEKKIYLEIEEEVVMKLRKILMMAKDKRIKAGKIDFARRTLGLPDDFATRVAPSYPQYFRVVGKSPSPFIELIAWDDSIAFSEMEIRAGIDGSNKKIDVKMEAPKEKKIDVKIKVSSKNDGFGFCDDENVDTVNDAEVKGLNTEANPKMKPLKKDGFHLNQNETRGQPLPFKITHSPGMFLKRKNLELLERWQKLPYISPYQDYSWVNPGTFIAEKRVVGVLHEVLSLTFEKKALMQVLGRFREEFGLPQTIGKLVNRFPGIFYLSMRGNNKTVILREGYERESYHKSHLIEGDHPLVYLKYKYAQMVLDAPRIRASLRENAKSGNNGEVELQECKMGEEMESECSDEESDLSDSDYIDSELNEDETCSDDDHTDISDYEREEDHVNMIRKAKPNKEIW